VNRVQIADLNGDGNSDVLAVNGWGSPLENTMSIYIGRGDGTFEPEKAGPPHIVYDGQERQDRDVSRVKLADMNGDGLTDIYVVHGVNTQGTPARVWINQGNADFVEYAGPPHKVDDNTINETLDIARVMLADMTGDGASDVYVVNGWASTAQAYLYRLAVTPGDRVTSITNGLGAAVQIDYALMTDPLARAATGSRPYLKGTGSAYPVLELQPAMWLAAEQRSSNGSGGFSTVAYTYTAARMHLLGRGYLGFQAQEAKDVTQAVVETTSYRQDFPFIGMPSSSVTKLTDGRTLSDSSSTYAVESLGAGANARHFMYASRQTAHTWEINNTNRVITSTVTDNEYTEAIQYGNLTRSTVSVYSGLENTSAPFVTVNTNTYTNDPYSWFLGRLTRSTVWRSAPEVPLSRTRTSGFEYDAYTGLLSAEIVEPDDNTNLRVRTEYSRDAYGNIKATTVSGPDFVTRSTQTDYDARGQFPAKITNSLGHFVQPVHDPHTGAMTSSRDANNLTTRWQYDGFGRKTKETRPDNTWTTFTRQWCSGSYPSCGSGNLYKVVTQGSDGAQGIAEFDALERNTRSLAAAFDGSWIEQLTQFNAKGQVYRKSVPRFQYDTLYWTTFSYDAAGRLRQEDAPRNQYNATGKLTTTTYDGLTTTITNALNQDTVRTVNALGKVIEVRDDANVPVNYWYDEFDNLTRTRVNSNVKTDVVMDYDLRGRKISLADPDMGSWLYTYNALGELKTQRDAKLASIAMSYDKLGRMTSRNELEGTTTWTYDTRWKGALSTVTAPNGYTRQHYYDALGRPQRTQYVIAYTNYEYAYTYNMEGKLSSLKYPSGLSVAHYYNARGYLYAVSKVLPTDGMISCTPWRLTDDITVDACEALPAAGLIWRRDAMDALGNDTLWVQGTVETMASNDPANGYLTAIVSNTAGAGPVQSLNYTWDAIGNLTSRVDQLQGGMIERFDYDNMNRLLRSTVIGPRNTALTDISVSYDALGNITYKSDTGNYIYGSSRPHAVTSISGTRAATYGYDANGNQASGGGRTMTWTSYNLPRSMRKDANVSDFSYGPDRERIQQVSRVTLADQTVSTSTVNYVGGLYEQEIKSTKYGTVGVNKHYVRAGRLVAIYTSADVMDASSSQSEAGTYQFLHYDHRDSVDVMTNAAGTVLQRFSYDAFGKRRTIEWLNDPNDAEMKLPHLTDRGFTGQQHLDGVGLIHYGGRVYDPVIGRFTSMDPFIQAPDDTQSYNRYSYVRNNPLSLTDPSGFSWWGKQVRRLSRETHRWERDFRHEIRRPNSLLGPTLQIAGAAASLLCGPAAPGCAASVVAATSVAVARAQGVTNARDLAKVGFVSAWTAGAFTAVGTAFPTGIENVVAHGFVGALSTAAQGGEFGAGFLSGALGAAVPLPSNPVAATLVSALVGGAAAELGGGKFANGAVTGAFAYAFGSLAQRGSSTTDPGASTTPDGTSSVFTGESIMVAGLDLPELPQGVVDFSAGLGDGILLGRGDELRAWAGVDGGVNPLSVQYGAGYATGVAETAVVGSFTRFRIGIDRPNHYFWGQRMPHVQMDAWLSGVRNSHVNVFRIPFPRSWYQP